MTAEPPQADLLLHACCGPCLLGMGRELAARGLAVHAWFHNPNVHGLIEFRRRLAAFVQAARLLKVGHHVDGRYGLTEFMAMWSDCREDRCRGCYRIRLEAAAAEAARLGIPMMATTLAIGPHQNHDLLMEEGAAACRRHGVKFLAEDFRSLHEAAVTEARRHSLYRQQYCGCIFSEYDRYRGTRKHVPRDIEEPID